MKRLFWFVLAGGTGFAVDAGVLQFFLIFTTVGPFVGRIGSIAVAMAATWFINRTFTFGRSERNLATEGARYGVVGVTTALLNYLVYSALLLGFPALWPAIAVAFSSLAAMLFSYLGYSRFVFGRSS